MASKNYDVEATIFAKGENVIRESDKTAVPFKKDGSTLTFETTANEVYVLI